ncbi:PREDICTED: cytochrome P450 4C1-like [Wasmannia auropunctata]|uniref:cytochrome P450 4C1-like n=1 Tax=Wasmannia auropunctata TaxID=64793 RepID=UPI0005EDEEE5|nr:PREDICTED: cytochrome P450 4C1-like [Wasmannia auropunctata]
MITILSILSIFIILVYNYYVHYRQNGRLINRIPGPPGYPIAGNIVKFIGYSREELWKTVMNLFDQYYPIYKIWAFYLPIVFIRHPDDLKIILSSPKHINKSMFYDILYPWLRTGLFISSGAKWHSQRKILSPAFHFNILQQFLEILTEEGENMIKSLKNTEGSFVKDLIPFVNEYTLNTICETVMGTSLRNIDENQQRKYREAIHQMQELFIYRLLRQWLHNDWIFSLVSKGREQREVIKILHGFTDQIIEERKLYHERTNNRFLKNLDNFTKAEADDAEMIGST